MDLQIGRRWADVDVCRSIPPFDVESWRWYLSSGFSHLLEWRKFGGTWGSLGGFLPVICYLPGLSVSEPPLHQSLPQAGLQVSSPGGLDAVSKMAFFLRKELGFSWGKVQVQADTRNLP